MQIPVAPVIHLLHEAPHAILSTHSTQLPGYPYGTAVPMVVDAAQQPLLLLSALAEHTRNLLADPRASLSVVKPEGGNIQSAARLTLVGDAERFEPCPELVARYLRYQPDAEQYLELDFMFFRLHPRRVRFIAGVGKMGWLESDEWEAIPAIASADEAALLKTATLQAPAGIRLLGIDCFGIDYEVKGQRQRQRFPDPPLLPERRGEVLARMVPKLS